MSEQGRVGGHGQPLSGDPIDPNDDNYAPHGHYAYGQHPAHGAPTGPAAPVGRGGAPSGRAWLLGVLAAVLLVGLGYAGHFVLAGGSSSTPRAQPQAAPTFPSTTSPALVLPTLELPTPGQPAGFSACAVAPTASTAATVYVDLAEAGLVSQAQSCVYRGGVPVSTTERIGAGGAASLYTPTGGTGSVFEFTSVDQSSRLSVTVSKEPDGGYYVTRVEAS